MSTAAFLNEFLSRLDSVKSRGQGRWSARCPAHNDRSPSLSVSGGDKGILLRCFAGCGVSDILKSLSLEAKDLFFDSLSDDPKQRRHQAAERARRRAAHAEEARRSGRVIDARREASYLIASRTGLDITGWSDEKLSEELNLLAAAYEVLRADDHEAH